MINITKLYCEVATSGDALQYEQDEKSSAEQKPFVVWNITRGYDNELY